MIERCPHFSPSALATIIEKAPNHLPPVFVCRAKNRFTAAVLSSQLARLDYTVIVDEQHRIEARGQQHASLGADYRTICDCPRARPGGTPKS